MRTAMTAKPAKSRVVRSFNLDGELQCVDLFVRPDGSYGFEVYRRDPEDGRGWFAVGHHAGQRYESADETMAAAKTAVVWLSEVARGG